MMNIFVFLGGVFLASCAGNVATEYVPLTKEQQAKQALDLFEWDNAIMLYEELIVEQPAQYSFLALIATAYAGRGGVDIYRIAGSKVSGTGNFIELVNQFVPREPETTQVDDVGRAISYLEDIPLEIVSEDLANSAQSQMTIYLAARSVMMINRFSSLTPTGQLDPERLAEMTEEDAEEILASLEEAVATTQDPVLKAKLESTLASIEEMEGETQEEKLKNFLQSQKQN